MSEPEYTHKTGEKAQSSDLELDLTIGEGWFVWPENVPTSPHGNRNAKPSLLFDLALTWLTKQTSLKWVAFFDRGDGVNSVMEFPILIDEMESLFQYELNARFSETHLALLAEADCLIVGLDQATGNLCGFGSGTYTKRGTVPGVRAHITNAGIMVISKGYQSKRLAPLLAFTVAAYGHSVLSIFQREFIVVRSNNKYIERILRKAEPVFRSDQLLKTDSEEQSQAKTAIEWTHRNIFHLSSSSLHFDKPLKIEHSFKSHETMDGLAPNEIVYLARCSSLAYFFFRVLGKSGRLKPQK